MRVSTRLKKLSNCQLIRVCKPRIVDLTASAHNLSLIWMVSRLYDLNEDVGGGIP
jgi:hypothetical protein